MPPGRRKSLEGGADPTAIPGGPNDLLSQINGGAPATDPFADFPPSQAATAAPAGSDPFATVAPSSGSFGALPTPTAIPGMDALGNTISASTIAASVAPGGAPVAGSVPVDPVISHAIQDIQTKLARLQKIDTTLGEVISVVNTIGRQVTGIFENVEQFAANQKVANGELLAMLTAIQQQPQVANAGSPAPAAPIVPPTRPELIVKAIGEAVLAKRANEPTFRFAWSEAPEKWFAALAGICHRAGVEGATQQEIEGALRAAGKITPNDIVF